MQRTELVAYLAVKCGVSQDAVDALLDELAEVAVSETNTRNVFELPGIGIMVKSFREERMGRNPYTGEEVWLPARTAIKFRLDEKVRAMCGDGWEKAST